MPFSRAKSGRTSRSSPLFVALLAAPLSVSTAAPVDIGREVRPILSDKCFNCHGPDEGSRKAKLRLDTREGALRLKNDVAAIVPGKSAESELIIRITSAEPDEVMPPPESKLKGLTPAEVATLKRWIDEGATYQPHWAFEPPAADAPSPTIENRKSKIENPLDRFTAAGLAARGLALQPEADRATLIRRLSFDLTCLPPPPADVAAFESTSIENPKSAIENLVDRLLASPRYGERRAADWLDVARYPDSYGFFNNDVNVIPDFSETLADADLFLVSLGWLPAKAIL